MWIFWMIAGGCAFLVTGAVICGIAEGVSTLAKQRRSDLVCDVTEAVREVLPKMILEAMEDAFAKKGDDDDQAS